MKVEKALTPEEMTLLANIKSLVAELEGMQAPVAATPEVGMTMKQLPMEEEVATQYDEEEVEKAIEHADADEHTANDRAETRIEDIPDTDDESLREVAKMFARLVNNKTQKSQPKNELVTAIHGLAKVVKGMNMRVGQQDAILSEILEGLGVTKSVVDQRVERNTKKPVQSTDPEFMAQVFKAMADAFGNKEKQVDEPANMSTVHKNMGNVLEALGQNGPWDH